MGFGGLFRFVLGWGWGSGDWDGWNYYWDGAMVCPNTLIRLVSSSYHTLTHSINY